MDAIEEAKRRLLRLFPEGSDGVFGPLINAIIEKAVCDSSMSREAEAVRRHEEAAMAGGPDRFVRATFATEWFTTLGWLPPEAAQQKDAEVERLTMEVDRRLCDSCLEHHPIDSPCPPHEVRTSGSGWFQKRVVEKDAEIERLNNELAEAGATMFDKLVEQRNRNNVEKTAMNSKLVKALRDKNEVQEQVVRLVATMRNAAQKLLRGCGDEPIGP
ncbi:hypothetical protein KKF82_07580 [Patescibacteria group bacterium]|nr:hypothetical protein [Patescibacteria group bacterium]